MQKLTSLINEAKQKGQGDNQSVINIIREYLQVLVLKAIYQSKYGKGLSFMGGTCLRICHDLKRYSEDLDFAQDVKIPGYSFTELNVAIVSFLKRTEFEVDVQVKEENIVQKSFLRVNKVLHLFGVSPLESQKVHVKLEIDTNPTPIDETRRETFFVTKFDEMFPIIKHTDETLFAGKICAVLNRAYTKGRDFYDLMWYLNRKTGINMEYLNASLKLSLQNEREIMEMLEKKISSLDQMEIVKDIERFLQDPSDIDWLRQYHSAFAQASKKYFE